jgi:hypothetical protein
VTHRPAGPEVLDRVDQRDAAKGCTDLLAPSGSATLLVRRLRRACRGPAAATRTWRPWLKSPAWFIAHRHHGITVGVAHYEVRAAAVAHRRGMTYEDIASATGLSVTDVRACLT